jgi:hypothetical protein
MSPVSKILIYFHHFLHSSWTKITERKVGFRTHIHIYNPRSVHSGHSRRNYSYILELHNAIFSNFLVIIIPSLLYCVKFEVFSVVTEDNHLLDCDVMWSCGYVLMYQRTSLPPQAGWMSLPSWWQRQKVSVNYQWGVTNMQVTGGTLILCWILNGIIV